MTPISAFCLSSPHSLRTRVSHVGGRTCARRAHVAVAVASGEAVRRGGKVDAGDVVVGGGDEGKEDAPPTMSPVEAVMETSIGCVEDVNQILALVDEFGVKDLRLKDGDVVVEVSRAGGRGFEDGKLVKKSGDGRAVVERVVEEIVEDGETVEGRAEVVETAGRDGGEPKDVREAVASGEKETGDDPNMVYESDFVVTSNRVGFFFSGAKNKPPLVMVGDHVAFNQPVCIIEQLGQQYVYLSEASGTVVKVFVEDGDAVEYGQQVMVIRPD